MLGLLQTLANLAALVLRQLATLLLVAFRALQLPGSAADAALKCFRNLVSTALRLLFGLLHDAIVLLVSDAFGLLVSTLSKSLDLVAFAGYLTGGLVSVVKDALADALQHAFEHAAGLLLEALRLLSGHTKEAAASLSGVLLEASLRLSELLTNVLFSLASEGVELLISAGMASANSTATAVGRLVGGAVAMIENLPDNLEKVERAATTILAAWGYVAA